MAEAITLVGLVASIASLVDLSAKVVSRIGEYVSKTDVPESLRSLYTKLLLLTATLERIRAQAEASSLSDEVKQALKTVIDDTCNLVSFVHLRLSSISLSDHDSKFERVFKALKSLAKEDQIRGTVAKIHENNEFLVLYQTTVHADTSTLILEKLSRLSLKPLSHSYAYGVCLGRAPQITADAFVGRHTELQLLRDWLSPKEHPNTQRVVSIVGMGGLGKTQLSLAHVRDCADDHSSVFWIDAKDESSLRQSLVDLSTVIFPESPGPAASSVEDETRNVERVRRWLSEPENTRWLLLLDNYDDPRLLGTETTTGYDVREYFPSRAQGSILITTRSTRLTFSKQLSLKRMDNIDESLAILSGASGRPTQGDASAIRLAQRLDGLPLALVTAGSYLNQSIDSFDDYLEMYNHSWDDLSQNSDSPLDYVGRTLYSTWNVSFQHVQQRDSAAAELLKLFAYFDNQDLWYELFDVELKEPPSWWVDVMKSRARFNRAVSILNSYSLLELDVGRFSMHPCEHDWTLEYLNRDIDPKMCQIAIRCVAANVGNKLKEGYWNKARRFVQHARRFEQARLKAAINWDPVEFRDVYDLRDFYWEIKMDISAINMGRLVLSRHEKQFGLQNPRTLQAMFDLGTVYGNQGDLAAAETTLLRAMHGYEKNGDTRSATVIYRLGSLYEDQGNTTAAQELYSRARLGEGETMAEVASKKPRALKDPGRIYALQGKVDEAEEMLHQALAGFEKKGEKHRFSVADTAHHLGALFHVSGKTAKAEEMYLQALHEGEKVMGADHPHTLKTIFKLSILYGKQCRWAEAEELYLRVLAEAEKRYKEERIYVPPADLSLGYLFHEQGMFDEAERIYLRGLAVYEKVLGKDHQETQALSHYLECLERDRAEITESQQDNIESVDDEDIHSQEPPELSRHLHSDADGPSSCKF